MTEFDPDKFEDKYANYFPELQKSYKQAFEAMNDRYDSELIHAIDQQILNESEPFYDEDRGFYVDLPENPTDRLTAVVADDEKVETILGTYVERIESELHRIFGVEKPELDQ
jgi:hypothetical protein